MRQANSSSSLLACGRVAIGMVGLLDPNSAVSQSNLRPPVKGSNAMSNSLPSLGGNLPSLGGQSQGSLQTQSVKSQFSQDTGLGRSLLNVMDQIVAHLLTQQPVDSTNKPTGTTVYLQYQTGQGVDPRQYANPWTPMGGSSLQSVLQSGQVSPSQPTTTPSGGTSTATPTVDTALQASLMAAWETSNLVDSMFLVDDKGQLQTYQGGGRSLAFAYGEIIQGMQPANPAQPSAAVQAAVSQAQSVLWQTDSNGNVTGPTTLYQNYLNNQMAWAQAKSNLAAAQAEALTDPALGQVWPQMAATYQTAVEQAYNTWISEGAPTVEQALATIESEGEDVVDAMVASAKSLFQSWSLAGLSGVPSQTQYSMVSPVSWYDPSNDDIGWSKLTVSSQSAAQAAQQNQNTFSDSWYNAHSSSTSAGGGGSFFGISLGASGGATNSGDANAQGSVSVTTSSAEDQTTNVSISLEWLLCQVQRPWLVSDLFYMDGWYMVNQRKNTISDGTVRGQVENEHQLLPMIPTAFLVVRNVSITASNWGQAGQSLQAAHAAAQSANQSSSSNYSGSVGFFGIGASAAHSAANASGEATSGSSQQLDWSWQGDQTQGTLTINGAQILGWVGSIVPASAPVDDPTLPAENNGTSGSGSASSSSASQGNSTTPSAPPSGPSMPAMPSNPVPVGSASAPSQSGS